MSAMTIPAIRKRLYALAARHGMPELEELADASRRTCTARRAPTRHAPITASQVAAIKHLKAKHPDWHQSDIANLVGTNQGRVSETLAGLHDHLEDEA